jgi:hypothetical protein
MVEYEAKITVEEAVHTVIYTGIQSQECNSLYRVSFLGTESFFSCGIGRKEDGIKMKE